MKSDKEMSDCLLGNILVDVADRIVSSAKENSHFEVVYRVAKWGKIEEKAFWNTYGEIQSGIIPDSDVKYPKDDIGTYSTSVYDQQKSCDKYIRCLKRSIRLKKVYPRPVVIREKPKMDWFRGRLTESRNITIQRILTGGFIRGRHQM